MSPKQYFIENAIKINRVCCGSARALREGLENEEEIEKSQYLSSPALGAFVLKNYHNRFMGNMFFIIFIWSDFQSNLKFVWCSEWKKATKQVAKLLIPPNKKKGGRKVRDESLFVNRKTFFVVFWVFIDRTFVVNRFSRLVHLASCRGTSHVPP